MTGRRLYEIVTDEVRRARVLVGTSWDDDSSTARNFIETPVAWAFLAAREREAWNAAAKRAKGRR